METLVAFHVFLSKNFHVFPAYPPRFPLRHTGTMHPFRQNMARHCLSVFIFIYSSTYIQITVLIPKQGKSSVIFFDTFTVLSPSYMNMVCFFMYFSLLYCLLVRFYHFLHIILTYLLLDLFLLCNLFFALQNVFKKAAILYK